MGFFDFFKKSKDTADEDEVALTKKDRVRTTLPFIPSDELYEVQKWDSEWNAYAKHILYSGSDKFRCRNKAILSNTLRLYCIADTHGRITKTDIDKFKAFARLHTADYLLFFGDHSYDDIAAIFDANVFDRSSHILAVMGNHDRHGIYELNSLKTYNGEIMCGFAFMEGSIKDKPTGITLTQEESYALSNNIVDDDVPVPILLSHDKPYLPDTGSDAVHKGLIGITNFCCKHDVLFNLHGHVHENYQKRMPNGTLEVSLFGINYVELCGENAKVVQISNCMGE